MHSCTCQNPDMADPEWVGWMGIKAFGFRVNKKLLCFLNQTFDSTLPTHIVNSLICPLKSCHPNIETKQLLTGNSQ